MDRRSFAVPLVLFIIALLVRLPYYTSYPAPTDETDEIVLAYRMAHDGDVPLTADDPYLGAHLVYLAAAVFRVFGASFEAARTVSLFLGALIVPATYWLGGEMGGRRAAIVASLLALAAFGSVVIGSHVFWSHGSAPALLALTLVCLSKARGGGARWSFLAGVFLGLGLSAHPTIVTFWPGMFLAALVTGSRPVQGWARRALWLLAGFVVAYAPGLLFVLRYGVGTFVGRTEDRAYVGLDLSDWPVTAAAWVGGVGRNLVGPGIADPTDPLTWIGVGVVVLASVVAVRQRRWELVLTAVSGALFMSLVLTPDRFQSLTGLRYTAPALPLVLVAVGCGVASMTARGGRSAWLGPASVVCLLAVQLVSLAGFYRTVNQIGVTAGPILAVVHGMTASAGEGNALLLDDEIDTKLGGGGEVGRAVKALMRVSGTESTIANVDKMRWFLLNGRGATYDMLLSGDYAAVLGAEFALEPLMVEALKPGQVSRTGETWGWYRYTSPP